MIIRYIGAQEYNTIRSCININLGGNFKFWLSDKNLHVEYNSAYVDGKSLYNPIDDISAIVGKNGSGKTTVLKIISNIIGGNGKHYILVLQENKIFYLYTDLKNDVNLSLAEKEIRARDYCIEILDKKSDIASKFCQIYFSNIFDKTTPLIENDNLVDLSTNSELRIFMNAGKCLDEQKGDIENFKYSEVNKKMELAYFLSESGFDYKSLLFNLPEYVEIYFVQNRIKVDEYKINAQKVMDREQKVYFDNLMQNIDEYLLQDVTDKDKVMNQFLIYQLESIVLNNLNENRCNIYDLLGYLKKLNKKWEAIIPSRQADENRKNKLKKGGESSKYDYERETAGELINDIETYLEKMDSDSYYIEIDKIDELENNMYEWTEEIRKQDIDINIEILEEMKNDIEVLKTEYEKLEIEEIQEVVQDIAFLLTDILGDIKDSTMDSIREYATLNEARSLETFSEIDELDEVNVVLDTEVIEDIKQKIEICNLFEAVIKSKDSNLEGKRFLIKTQNKTLLEFHKKMMAYSERTFDAVIDHMDLSSGHNGYLDMLSRICDFVIKEDKIEAEQVILLLDEGEMYLHPQAQAQYIKNLVLILPQLFRNKKIQIIITTNSPFILSDIQASNVLYLNEIVNKKICVEKKEGRTFGANIALLLIDSFFMKDGIVGEQAKEVINDIIEKILAFNTLKLETQQNVFKIVDLVGDPLVRKKLENMIVEKSNNKNLIDQEIEYYQWKIKRLRQRNGEK